MHLAGLPIVPKILYFLLNLGQKCEININNVDEIMIKLA